MRRILCLLIALLLALCGFPQSSKNVELLSQIQFLGEWTTDVESYADSLGVEYALVGTDTTLTIVSLADPASPVILQRIRCGGGQTEVEERNGFVYVMGDSGGIGIADLRGLPAVPVPYRDTIFDEIGYFHTMAIDEDRLYLHASSDPTLLLVAVDLSDPWRPSFAGGLAGYYPHDGYYRNDTGYVAVPSAGVVIVDFTDAASPFIIATTPSEFGYTHNTWLSDDGKVLFVADETPGSAIVSYDISDLGNITELDRICTGLESCVAIPHNFRVKDGFILLGHYTDGLRVIDASRPHNLIQVGWYDTHPDSTAKFDGAWGADPFYDSGIVVVGDMSNGLHVFRPEYRRAAYLEGTVYDSLTGLPIAGAHLQILGTSAESFSLPDGEYALGLADSGHYWVVCSVVGYMADTVSVLLDNSVLTLQDFPLIPFPTHDHDLILMDESAGLPLMGKVHAEHLASGLQRSLTADAAGRVTLLEAEEGDWQVIAGGVWGWATMSNVIRVDSIHLQDTIWIPKGYYDDFLFDQDWIIIPSALVTGIWERAVPVGTGLGFPTITYACNPYQDVATDYGQHCMVTGNGGGSADFDDLDGGPMVLYSPPMDLSGYTRPMATFYRWFADRDPAAGSVNDTLFIEVSDGSTTKTAHKVFGADANTWVADSVVLSDFFPPGPGIRVVFKARDYIPTNDYVEAAIDRFKVFDAAAVQMDAPSPPPQLSLHPNPLGSGQTLHLSCPMLASAGGEILFTDALGRIVMRERCAPGSADHSMEVQLPPGLYLVRVATPTGDLASGRLLMR